MNCFLNSFLIFLLFTTSGSPQEEKVVAKVGSYNISESEFKDRFDFSAKPKLLNNSDRAAAKLEFLKKLIAEKLLSLEARERGYHNSEEFREMIVPLENMYIRDALYTEEIKNKVRVSDKDISEGISRISKVFEIEFIFSKDLGEIGGLYELLQSGSSFDSLLSSRPEAASNPKEVTFGTMDKDIEDVVYTLKPGEFTAPVISKDGYYILKLKEIKENTALRDRELALEEVNKIIKTRAEYKIYHKYHRNFFSEKKASADKYIFESLIKELVPAFIKKYPPTDLLKHEKYFLRGAELLSILSELHQGEIFIQMVNPVRLKTFINQLSQDGLYVTEPVEMSIRASLSSYIRKFIEDQFLTEEGRIKGIDKNTQVEKSIRIWEDSYLSKFITAGIWDSTIVSDEEVFYVFSQKEWKEAPLQLVNIVEVLVDSPEKSEIVLNRLKKGEDLKSFAEELTLRESLKSKNGETGFISVSELGEIGRIATRMNIGEIYGPLKTNEGYSIFQLIGKKEDVGIRNRSFEEVKEDIKNYIRQNKYEKNISIYLSGLAKKHGIVIFKDVLNGINNIFLNLVIVRYMGFGGEIFAVPYTEQNTGWYELWQRDQIMAP